MLLIFRNMSKTFSWRRALLATLVFGAFFVSEPVFADAPRLVITEVNPAGGWIEFQNLSDTEIVPNGNWFLTHLSDPMNMLSEQNIPLPASFPARSLIVVPANLGKTGDLIYFDDNFGPMTTISYGTLDPNLGDPNLTLPADSQSIGTSTSGWAFVTPSKGWFNDASGAGSATLAPALNVITSALSSLSPSIETNLATLPDPTNATGLYFSSTGRGRIEFSSTLNLTGSSTVISIRNLLTNLQLGNGIISFNPETASVLENSGARLTMYGLPTSRTYDIDSLTVLDDAGQPTTTASIVSNVSYDQNTGTLAFDAAHFTSFIVSTTTEGAGGGGGAVYSAPLIEFVSPANNAVVASGTQVTVTASTTAPAGANTTVRFSITTNSGLTTVVDQVKTEPDLPGGQAYSLIWNTTGLEGEFQLAAEINDGTSSVLAVTRSVTIASEDTPPSGSIISPAAGFLATSTVRLLANAADASGIASVKFYLDGNRFLGIASDNGDGTYSLDWNPVGQGLAGVHSLYAVIADLPGNSTLTPAQDLNIDAALPTATFTYSPAGTTRSDVTATLIPSRAVTVTNNGGSGQYLFTDNGSFEFEFIDAVGHTGRATAVVNFIDRTAPLISGMLPIAGSRIGLTTKLIFTDPETYGDPDCLFVGRPGAGTSCVSGTAFGGISGFAVMPDGPFTLKIRHTDALGNVGSTTINYIKDTVKPQFVSATVTDATHVKVRFNEDLESNSSLEHYVSADDFLVRYGGQVDPITAFSEDNGLITLTLGTPFVGTNPAILLTLNPGQPMSIVDPAGNDQKAATTTTVSDGIAPLLLSAVTADSRTLTLDFSENLKNDAINSPQAVDFNFYAIRRGMVMEFPISRVVTEAGRITLYFADYFQAGDDIRFSLREAANIMDLSGNRFNNGAAYSGSISNTLYAGGSSGGGGSGGGGGGGGLPPAGLGNIGGAVLGVEIFRFSRDLKYCQTLAPDVKELQKRLMLEGYMATSTLTSYFGPKTLAAVKKYQRAHNLPDTGFVGPLTRAALNGGLKSVSRETKLADLLAQLQNIQALLKELKAP
jgi:hypothetical protein